MTSTKFPTKHMTHYAKCDGYSATISLTQDPGQAGKSQVAYFAKLLAGFRVKALIVTGDRSARAEPFASQVNVGNVCQLKAPWNAALVFEMRNFPNSI